MSFLAIGWLTIIVWNLIIILSGTKQLIKNHVHAKSRHCSGRCPHCRKG